MLAPGPKAGVSPYPSWPSWLLSVCLLVLAGTARAEAPPDPGPRDTCPVCGMFVAKYPEWVATVRHGDGHHAHFDGAKDMFKYLLDPERYAQGHGPTQKAWVTEYYGVTRIDAREAWYVIGSDVYGPMGHELVPLAVEEDAREFLVDHGGARIVRYQDVDRALLEALDAGRL